MTMPTSPQDPWLSALLSQRDATQILALESNGTIAGERLNYLFTTPEKVITAHSHHEVSSALDEVQKGIDSGYHAAGFISYEAGYSLGDCFVPPDNADMPLLWFGLFDSPAIFDPNAGKWLSPPHDLPCTPPGARPFAIHSPRLSESYDSYSRKIGTIKKHIESGDTYQINYTMRLDFDLSGDPFDLYLHLRNRQQVDYSCYWRDGDFTLLSLSPELFFRTNGNDITVKPMKGTTRRGLDCREDDALRHFLRNDIKNRAENVMIVDLLRNDLGRICEPEKVAVDRLFEIEDYETLFQMTSTVRGEMRRGLSVRELLSSMFPSGSVTGAPKISSMKIIRALESSPRSIYTGAIGFFSPRFETSVFNVAIRTIETAGDKCRLGIGGGIVYDSTPHAEWQEAILKAKFLTDSFDNKPPEGFELIESLEWNPHTGYTFTDYHLERLASSATFFNIHCDTSAAMDSLEDFAGSLTPSSRHKVRLTLAPSGVFSITALPLADPPAGFVPRVTMCPQAVISTSPFLSHKTNVRAFYDIALDHFSRLGFFDVLFVNERNEITEGARTNIIVEHHGEMFTPPASCGLLPGTFRRHLIESGHVSEKIITPDELITANAIYVCNSVRGLVRCLFAPSEFI